MSQLAREHPDDWEARLATGHVIPESARRTYRTNEKCDGQMFCGAEYHTKACPSFGRPGTGIDSGRTSGR